MKLQIQTIRFSIRNLNLVLMVMLLLGGELPQSAVPVKALENVAITIIPDQMSFSGDIATKANTVGYCTESWLSTMPAGSIILGIDPTSCDPLDWNGASATVSVSLPNIYPSTIYVVELSWPDRDGKGLHSPVKNQTASILLDGQPVWNKRTTDLSDFGDYYGALHEPIKTTLVVKQSSTHTLTFSVPPKTAWDLSKIELTAYALPSKLQGVGYSPYRDCQSPGGTEQPSIQNMQEDLVRLFHTSNAIRTYSSTGVNAQIPPLAASLGLPIFVGAWLDSNTNDATEIQGLINLSNSYDLDGVIVGNEYYLRHRTTADIEYLRQKIVQVKNSIPAGLPVMTAEIDSLMFDWTGSEPVIQPVYRSILDQVDVVMVHIYPFWEGLPIDGAANYTVAHYKAIQSLIEREYPGQHKRVIIGEAGWPSAGGAQSQAVPSLQNQLRYLLEFYSLAEQQGVEYFYFDGFDELWKIEEPEHVGQNWGYSYADHSAKHSFYGTLLPSEQLLSYNAVPLSSQQFQDEKPTESAAQIAKTFDVYTEWPESPGHFVPSGAMGDISSIGLFECDRSNPHSGDMAMRLTFSSTGTLGWAGVYWQYPKNNWGKINSSIDLSWANKLTFWAKGEHGGEKVKFLVGGIGTSTDLYPDSLRPGVSTGFIPLTSEWQSYTIDLRGKDLTHLIGGFGWVTDKCANPDGATFYVDDVVFEYDANMPNPQPVGPVFPVYTDAAAQNNHFTPSNLMGDGEVAGRVSITECWTNNPHSGKTAIKITYTQNVIGWAGTYWVEPAENKGDRPGGIDLTGAKRVSFWARTDTPGAQVKFTIGGIGYKADWDSSTLCNQPNGMYPDSVCPKIEQTEFLNNTWTKYVIDLSVAPKNMSRVVGGFGWVSKQPVTFYLDDIVYEFDRALINITIGEADKGNHTVASNPSSLMSFTNTLDGPVKVASINGDKIIPSQRAVFGNSFNELMGYPADQFTTEYWFPWYDQIYMNTWILVGNPSSTQTAYVDIYIGGKIKGSYAIPPGDRVTPQFPGVLDGPVRVVSVSGAGTPTPLNIFASERSTYLSSFNEVMGYPADQFTTEYWFPWYDQVYMNSWVLVGNPSTTDTAYVDIYIGGVKQGDTREIVPNGNITPQFPGVLDGPVRVVSVTGPGTTTAIPIFASERSTYRGSFSEVMGYPTSQFTTDYWYTWYDNQGMTSWILVGNPSSTQTGYVEIYIDGVKQGDTFTIPPNGNITPQFAASSGPVRVLSVTGDGTPTAIPIFTSERSLYGPSFNEMMGYPADQLTTEYWFTWYDSVYMKTDIYVAKP